MKKVGIIGWRGMVGSVLMERMSKEDDFKRFTPLFFTTSQVGQKGPDIGIVGADCILNPVQQSHRLTLRFPIQSSHSNDATIVPVLYLEAANAEADWLSCCKSMKLDKNRGAVGPPVAAHGARFLCYLYTVLVVTL